MTEMLTEIGSSADIDDIVGRPEEIVNVMLMMISPGNTFMNGQAIAVDGGSSAI
jgi:NAD(P)-dependent dehydrogenase (short-subunit alcohol dehydrogenase family)